MQDHHTHGSGRVVLQKFGEGHLTVAGLYWKPGNLLIGLSFQQPHLSRAIHINGRKQLMYIQMHPAHLLAADGPPDIVFWQQSLTPLDFFNPGSRLETRQLLSGQAETGIQN
jgi:hypothetical protein